MNTNNILPIEFHDFIRKRNFEVSSDSHYFRQQIIYPCIVERYGELTDDGYYELTKDGGGELDFYEVYGWKWVLEENNRYRDPQFYSIIPAYSISTVVDELLKYGIYVYVDLTEDGFVGRVKIFCKNSNSTHECEDVSINFSITSTIYSTCKFDNIYDAYKDIIYYTIKSRNWETMTKKENL